MNHFLTHIFRNSESFIVVWFYKIDEDFIIEINRGKRSFSAADSKKFALFSVKSGKYLGHINIPGHLERSKGKDEKHCMFEQTGLSLFIFDEDKLIGELPKIVERLQLAA